MNDATDNVGVTEYEIYRDGAKVGTSINNSYNSAGLISGKSYIYSVKACDAVGNKSIESIGIMVTAKTQVSIKTIIDNTEASIAYSGAWSTGADTNYQNSTKSVSSTINSSAELTFTGNIIRIYASKQSALGMFDVYIDGVKDATVDTYNASDLYQVKVYEKSGLANGTHAVKIILNGQKNIPSF